MVTLRYYDNMPLSQFYGRGGTLSPIVSVPSGTPFGSNFYMMSPGSIEGIRMWNVIPGGPTLRVGLFFNEIEILACRKDYPNVPLSVTDPINLKFTNSYQVTWEKLNSQNSNSLFTIVVYDKGNNFYQIDTGLKFIVSANWGPLGRCVYMPCTSFPYNMGGGWAHPSTSGGRSHGIDPIVLPEENDYEPTIWPHFYGSGHPNIICIAGGSQYTLGGQFFVKRTGCLVHGVRFYTHDAAQWTAKCCIYKTPGVLPLISQEQKTAFNPITGDWKGINDVFFKDGFGNLTPLEISSDVMKNQDAANTLIVTVYNKDNLNYTRCNPYTTPLVDGIPAEFDIHRTVGSAYRPNMFVAGDAIPTNFHATMAFPVSPIISRGT